MPINDNIKLKIIQLNWQTKFYIHIIDSAGQPKTNDLNELIITPLEYIIDENFSYTEWEKKVKMSIEKFLEKFIIERFDYDDNSKYYMDDLTIAAKKFSKKTIFIYFDRSCFYLMCHHNDLKILEDLLNRCLISNESKNESSKNSTNTNNNESKPKSNETDIVESLIEELEDMNRDKENPLYFFNQLILDNLYKEKRSTQNYALEEESHHSKKLKASTSTYDSDWDSS